MTIARIISLLLLLAALSTSALAQTRSQTLLGNNRLRGAFGAPIYEYGIGNSGINQAAGGGFGLVFNHFFLGAYGIGSVDFNRLFNDGEVDVLDLGHSGLWLGTVWPSHHLFHLYSSVRAGWGVVNVDFDDPTLGYNDIDKIFVLTPEIGAEVNVTRWFRVAGTVGYRWLRGAQANSGYSNADFSGLLGGITLRFGGFGRPNHLKGQ